MSRKNCNPLRMCAVNTGTELHLLDHIAPIAATFDMPLIVTEDLNYRLGKRFYPQVKLLYEPDLELKLSFLAQNFDVLFECRYWQSHLKNLFYTLYQKKMRLVFCPHGQSDKGFQAPLLAPYKDQDMVLLYGDLMVDMLKKLGIWPSISNFAIVGNYRYEFYKKHQTFYDEIVLNEIPLDRKNKTLLYAPTWNDADKATSFFQHGKKVIESTPSNWNLICKVHPLLEQRDPAGFYALETLAKNKPNVFLLNEFPPVYPVLNLADAYLGDASSVGYDFLHFQRPMYLFEQSSRLQSCTFRIDPNKDVFSQIEKTHPHGSKQKELYEFAFRKSECLKENILRVLRVSADCS